jgi:hypothetical protein
MPSYLDSTFLGDLGDEMGDDLGAENATMALTPAPGELAPLEYVRLPGGIMMEKQSFYIALLIAGFVALYLATKK